MERNLECVDFNQYNYNDFPTMPANMSCEIQSPLADQEPDFIHNNPFQLPDQESDFFHNQFQLPDQEPNFINNQSQLAEQEPDLINNQLNATTQDHLISQEIPISQQVDEEYQQTNLKSRDIEELLRLEKRQLINNKVEDSTICEDLSKRDSFISSEVEYFENIVRTHMVTKDELLKAIEIEKLEEKRLAKEIETIKQLVLALADYVSVIETDFKNADPTTLISKILRKKQGFLKHIAEFTKTKDKISHQWDKLILQKSQNQRDFNKKNSDLTHLFVEKKQKLEEYHGNIIGIGDSNEVLTVKLSAIQAENDEMLASHSEISKTISDMEYAIATKIKENETDKNEFACKKEKNLLRATEVEIKQNQIENFNKDISQRILEKKNHVEQMEASIFELEENVKGLQTMFDQKKVSWVQQYQQFQDALNVLTQQLRDKEEELNLVIHGNHDFAMLLDDLQINYIDKMEEYRTNLIRKSTLHCEVKELETLYNQEINRIKSVTDELEDVRNNNKEFTMNIGKIEQQIETEQLQINVLLTTKTLKNDHIILDNTKILDDFQMRISSLTISKDCLKEKLQYAELELADWNNQTKSLQTKLKDILQVKKTKSDKLKNIQCQIAKVNFQHDIPKHNVKSNDATISAAENLIPSILRSPGNSLGLTNSSKKVQFQGVSSSESTISSQAVLEMDKTQSLFDSLFDSTKYNVKSNEDNKFGKRRKLN